MRLDAAIRGDLRKMMQEEADRIRRAENAAVKKAGENAKAAARAHMAERNLRDLGFRWKVKYFPAKGDKGALAVLYVQGGSTRHRSKDIVYAFEQGATVRPRNGGRYLWIPTQFNRPQGRRRRNLSAGAALVQPDQVKGGFIKRSAAGHLLFFAPVEARGGQGKRGNATHAYLNNRLLGSGRRARTAEILKYGAVPLFTLLPQVTISKRTDVLGMAERFGADLARQFMQELERG